MSDGYAFIESSRTQAILVSDEPLTKVDIVKRGWASYPARILDDPSTKDFEGPVFTSTADAEKSVASGSAFKIGKWFYVMEFGGTEYHSSKYDGFYWRNDGTGSSFILDTILSALTAPVIDKPHVPYKFRWKTGGGEFFDVTVWSFNRKDGHHDFDLDYDYVFEYSALPGIGYKYEPEYSSLISSPDPGGEVPNTVPYLKEEGVLNPPIIINFPNSELGKNTCAVFKMVYETERVPHASPQGGVHIVNKYTSCGMKFIQFIFPELRRLPMPRFNPRTATDIISCHVMSRGDVKKLGDELNTKDFYDKIKNTLYGDGAGTILSLKWFYGIRPALSTPQKRKITLGNTILSTTTPVFAGEFLQLYMGGVYVGGKFGDYRDYTNVHIQVFIPMVGIVDLDPSAVVGKKVHMIYTVNLTDGSAVVTLSTTAASGGLEKVEGWYETDNIIFTTSFTYGYEIPLNVESIRSASLTVGEIVAKTVVGGAVGAVAGNIPGAVLGAVGGAVSALGGGVQSTYSSGSLTPNSNVMGDFTPKLITTFNEDVSGDISAAVGRPSGKVVKVGDARGYLKAAMVYGTPSSTMQHTDEIANMLKEGIYIS